MMFKNKKMYLGFLGLLGVSGFQYFQTHDIANLCGFAYFSFFAYFWIAKVSADTPDERYFENVRRAKAFAFNVALIEFMVLMAASILVPAVRAFLMVGVALCFASLVILYAVKLYRLEEK
jgi:hypothetical protein